MSRARIGFLANSTARRPVAVACRSRFPVGEGGVAPPGNINPSASAIVAMVDAVPITMHVPDVVARDPSTSSISTSFKSPLRYFDHILRQSVHAPSRSPCQLFVIMEPVTSKIAGISLLAAAIICAGTVLSQPPIRTTASIGWERISSSVSIAKRFRNNIDVGESKVSPKLIVGKTIGNPPASSTPLLTCSIISGTPR